jgi:signal transduction histidine kinase
MRDATAQKHAEDELHRAHEELERRVLERTAELAQTNDQLQAEIFERQRVEIARQNLLRQLVTAQEDERRRMSRELHDQLGQHLSALSLGLKSLQDADDAWPHGERRHSARTIETLRHQTEDLMEHVHRLAWELRPAVLDDYGLYTALDLYTAQWARRSRIKADIHSTGYLIDSKEQRMEPEIESSLYRVVQEALTNVERHSQATQVSVLLERQNDYVRVIIEDNGKGFDLEAVLNRPLRQRRLGLLGMRERVSLVNGTLTLESVPEQGTTVFARVPLNSEESEATGGEEATNSFS